MAYFDRHSPHVRRSIALAVTISIAAILIGVLIFSYTHKRDSADQEPSPLKDFYTTILNNKQSLPDTK